MIKSAMIIDTLLTNGHFLRAGGTPMGPLAIAGGRIQSLKPGSTLADAPQVIDLAGRLVMPGVIDIHVHFREPGQEYKATYRSESAAAAVGGVTTILDMPNNGPMAVTDLRRYLAKLDVGRRSSYVDFGAYAYLCSTDWAILAELVAAGVVGFKWDMSLAGTEVAPGVWMPLPEEALPYFAAVARTGARIGIHAEDRPAVLSRTLALKAAGRLDAAAHLAARPAAVEVTALVQAIDLCRRTGAQLHVHHLSSAAGLDLVRQAKAEGLPVTAETIPPFLFLDAGAYDRLGSTLKIHPAVKEASDREALWAGLRDGSIDCVATDHAPHTRQEKEQGIWDASPGAIGVQTSLALMLDAVAHGLLSLERCVEVMCEAPARLYDLYPRKGSLEPGADADLVVIDRDRFTTIRNEDMLSPNRLTPFDGRQVRGMPILTMLRGKIVAREGRPVGEPGGLPVFPGYGSFRTPLPSIPPLQPGQPG